MRKLLLSILALALLLNPALGQLSYYNSLLLEPQWAQFTASSFTDVTGMILDGATEKIAFKYYPATTSDITDIDVRLNVVLDPGSFKIGVFAHDATTNAPNDAAQLGTFSPGFDLGADGYTGLQTLATDTGALTINTPVWIVLARDSGTFDASNYIQLQRLSSSLTTGNRDLMRHHNGTDWTTTASQTVLPVFAVKHADLTYSGNPSGVTARTAQNDIYTNAGTVQTQGARYKFGSQVKIRGVKHLFTKSGTPDNLTLTVYEGDTSKYSSLEVAANLTTALQGVSFFTSPVLLAADTYIHVLATQTGTSDANDYDIHTNTVSATYISALAPADMRFVYGNGVVPSALTVSTTELPFLFPIISDPAADLDMSGTTTGKFISSLRPWRFPRVE